MNVLSKTKLDRRYNNILVARNLFWGQNQVPSLTSVVRESHKIVGQRVQCFTERFQCDSLGEELEFQALKIKLTTGIFIETCIQ